MIELREILKDVNGDPVFNDMKNFADSLNVEYLLTLTRCEVCNKLSVKQVFSNTTDFREIIICLFALADSLMNYFELTLEDLDEVAVHEHE